MDMLFYEACIGAHEGLASGVEAYIAAEGSLNRTLTCALWLNVSYTWMCTRAEIIVGVMPWLGGGGGLLVAR